MNIRLKDKIERLKRLKRIMEGSGYKSISASFLASYAIIILMPFSFIFYNAENLVLNIQNLYPFIIYFIFGSVFFVALLLSTRKFFKVDLSPVYAAIFLYLFIASWIVPNSTGILDGLRDSQVFSFNKDTLYQIGKVFIINSAIIFIYYKNRKFFKDMVMICLIGSFLLVIYTTTNFKYETEIEAKTETTKLADFSFNKNIIVISFDAIQGDIMDDIFRGDPSLLNGFDGFTFFPNTTGAAPNTARSIFLTLTGSIPPLKDTTKAWVLENKEKLLPSILANEGKYRVSAYGPATMIGGVLCRHILMPESCFAYDSFFEQYGSRYNSDFKKINDSIFYSALRILPAYLVNVANSFINRVLISDGLAMATHDKGKLGMGRPYYEYLQLVENLNARLASPVFTFQHYVFTHEPVTFDASCSYTNSENTAQDIESAKEQSLCVISLMKRTISKLKKLGIYDKSMILFMSDHGMSARFNPDSNINFGGFMPAARYNTFLMVKDFHSIGNAKISRLPASLLDVAPTVCNSAINSDYCNYQEYQGVDLKSLNGNKNRNRKLILYSGGKDVLNKDFSRYYSDLSLIEVVSFDGDIKGLENYFKISHPNYKKDFPNELLLNGDFSSGLYHWTQRGTVHTNVNGIIVNLNNHLFQDVDVDEDRDYFISYEITCASDATMRAQVNWLDAKRTFLSATGETYDCFSNSRVINKLIKTPSGSAVGRFYITTNDDNNITVKSVSFRK